MYHRCPLVIKDYLLLSEHVPDDLDETEAWEFASNPMGYIRPESFMTEKGYSSDFSDSSSVIYYKFYPNILFAHKISVIGISFAWLISLSIYNQFRQS